MISDLSAWRLSDFSTLMHTLGRFASRCEFAPPMVLTSGSSPARDSLRMYSASNVSPKAPPPMRRTMRQRLRTTSSTLSSGASGTVRASSPGGASGFVTASNIPAFSRFVFS